MIQLESGWSLDVERGPGWLFIRIHSPELTRSFEPIDMASQLWDLADEHFTYRLVLELEDVPILCSSLIGELLRLYKRLSSQDGTLRLSGMSPQHQVVLRASQLHVMFPPYSDRSEAVRGTRPRQPR
jgi:anti-anti-sigma factor